jgi:IPT/TIG domain
MNASKRYSLGIIFLFAIVIPAMAFSGCGKKPLPSISSVSQSSGAAGAEVTVLGSNFGAIQSNSTVDFGSATATVINWSDSEIEVKVPEELNAGETDVSVTTAGGTSEAAHFEVTKEEEESDDGEEEAKNTPKEAIVEFLEKEGEDPTGSSFAVYKVSKQDPDWMIYSETSHPGEPIDLPMFLLHKVNEEWIVLTWGTDISVHEYGGPSDLAL